MRFGVHLIILSALFSSPFCLSAEKAEKDEIVRPGVYRVHIPTLYTGGLAVPAIYAANLANSESLLKRDGSHLHASYFNRTSSLLYGATTKFWRLSLSAGGIYDFPRTQGYNVSLGAAFADFNLAVAGNHLGKPNSGFDLSIGGVFPDIFWAVVLREIDKRVSGADVSLAATIEPVSFAFDIKQTTPLFSRNIAFDLTASLDSRPLFVELGYLLRVQTNQSNGQWHGAITTAWSAYAISLLFHPFEKELGERTLGVMFRAQFL